MNSGQDNKTTDEKCDTELNNENVPANEEMDELSLYEAVIRHNAEMLEFVPFPVDYNANNDPTETARMCHLRNFKTNSLVMRLIGDGGEVNITDDKNKTLALCDALVRTKLEETNTKTDKETRKVNRKT